MRKSETLVQYTKENIRQLIRNNIKRGQGKLLPYMINRFQWTYFPKLKIVPRFPLNIDIEVSSRCNLACDHCFRQYMDIKENQLMDAGTYK